MNCMFGLTADCCSSCEAFDYCIEYADKMSYEDFLEYIKYGGNDDEKFKTV